eukprot:scaffold23394_cov37-Prasinocladus_malaysianus.AAC.1
MSDARPTKASAGPSVMILLNIDCKFARLSDSDQCSSLVFASVVGYWIGLLTWVDTHLQAAGRAAGFILPVCGGARAFPCHRVIWAGVQGTSAGGEIPFCTSSRATG